MKKCCWGCLFMIFLFFTVTCRRNPAEVYPKPSIWRFSTPEAQGMDSQILNTAFDQAKSRDFIDGLLVIRNGFIVAEQYYNGYDADQPHNIMSVSKSFLSAITGIALRKGVIRDLEEKVLDYFPEYITPDLDLRKYDITIRHLLTMRMGIQGEADNHYAVYFSLHESDNWVKSTLEMPLISNPGEKMGYNTFQTHLLSVILSKALGYSLLDFATENLFDPMKIDVDAWEQDPQGFYFGGSSMFFTPREMAMLGTLYLNQGLLDGVQVVPREWVELTLSASTNFNHPNEWGAYKNYNYAYLWWLGQINEIDLFMGYGYGGQFVVVFPDLNLIVVTTAKNQVDDDTSTIQEWALFDIISTSILPSVLD
jgi:CubicO group peptidase (beta-lactamase class C family)